MSGSCRFGLTSDDGAHDGARDHQAYLIEFSFNGARMHLKTFKEVPNAS